MECNLEEIVASINKFKIPGWTNVTAEQIRATKFGGGWLNTTLKVDKITDDQTGPRTILVKKYGGNTYSDELNGLLTVNSPLIQSLIFHEQSTRGWGPKLYGILDDGRIEEFVDCHVLTGEEAFTPEICTDMAKAYARFHSLDLPIKREHFDLYRNLLPSLDEARKQLSEFIQSPKAAELQVTGPFQVLYDFPFEKEVEWIYSILPKIHQRTVLSTMDPNYQNRLVRNQKPSDPNVTQTVIIDFDITAYSHRGFDLSGHFVDRMFNWTKEGTKLSGMPYPSEAEQRTFLAAYLEELEKQINDFDKNSLDSPENLMLETEVNAFISIPAFLVMSFTMYSMLEKDPCIVTYLEPVISLYFELKDKFCAKYPHLANS